MPKFIFAYHGGSTPASPEEGKRMMQAWTDWATWMGKAVVDIGHPVGKSATVSATGFLPEGGANPLSGYSVIEAADLEAAVVLAKSCPILRSGSGTVEIAPVVAM